MKAKKALSILHFPFYILLIFTITYCSNPVSTPKGSLTGTVHLENQQDHSDITVALYDLAYLDTTIVRINNQYPHIGVIITQHTEFDHRLQSPVKSTETLADGSFELTKITTGTYNLVAEKTGFGFKYLYEIAIEEGENEISQARCHHFGRLSTTPEFIEGRSEISKLTPNSPLGLRQGYAPTCRTLSKKRGGERTHPSVPSVGGRTQSLKKGGKLKNSERGVPFDPFPLSFCLEGSRTSDLTLYPELHISGNISDNITVLPDHHLIIDDHTDFVPNTSSLTIEPGAVIRINPGVDLTIHGNLLAQGEENNMFWITSNSGFAANERQKTKGKRQKVKYRNIEVIERNVNNSNSFFLPDHRNLGEGGSPLSFNLENRDSDILLYNSFELTEICNIENDLIEWGKWDYANTCLLNHVNNLHMQYGIFRDGGCGFYSTDVDSTFCENSNFVKCVNESEIGLYILEIITGSISKNIFTNNYIGLKIKDKVSINTFNNFFCSNINGVYLMSYVEEKHKGELYNNEFQNNNNGIKLSGPTAPIISHNNISDIVGIRLIQDAYYINSQPYICNNNFFLQDWFIYIEPCNEYDIDTENNYFNGYDNIQTIYEFIKDKDDYEGASQNSVGTVNIISISINIIENSGI